MTDRLPQTRAGRLALLEDLARPHVDADGVTHPAILTHDEFLKLAQRETSDDEDMRIET